MNSNQEVQKLQIHYYFEDNSHSMNALVRNRAEKDLLDAIQRISEITENEIIVQSEAYAEGGLVETLVFVFSGLGVLKHFAPSINGVIQYHFTRDKELESLTKKKLQEEIKNLELDNFKKEEDILEDKQTMRYISNFYKKIDAYPKIKSIGFKSLSDNTEYQVDKERFKEFVLHDDKTVIEDDEAEIDIISPVLKEGKYKWKGKYNNEKIDFSMGDSKFKDDVIHSKYSFSNGITILCQLQITITYDEFGDEKRRSHSVKKVYGIKQNSDTHVRLRPSGVRKKKEDFDAEHVKSLFSSDDYE